MTLDRSSSTASDSHPRIVILAPWNLENINGSSIRTHRILPILRDHFSVFILAGGLVDKNPSECEGFPVYNFFHETGSPPFLRHFLTNLRFLKRIISLKPDLIIAESSYAFLPSLFLTSRILGTKVIFEAHAVFHLEQKAISKTFSKLLEINEYLIGMLMDSIVALSQVTFQFYARLNKRVFYIPTFVDLEKYPFIGPRSPPTSRFRVGMIGPFDGLHNYTQIEFLLENLTRFDKRIEFVLLGRMRPISLPRVQCTGYVASESDYVSVLGTLDALIVPVRLGTYGPKNKILEAMAVGVPVMSTPEGVFGLDHGTNGINMLIFTREEFVSKVNNMIFRRELNEVGLAGRKMVENYYSKATCAPRLLNVVWKLTKVHVNG